MFVRQLLQYFCKHINLIRHGDSYRQYYYDYMSNSGSIPFPIWFEGSVFRKPDGTPAPFWHGTCAVFDDYYPYSHFGTPAQANVGWMRSYSTFNIGVAEPSSLYMYMRGHKDFPVGFHAGVIHCVALSIRRPLRIRDPGGNHDAVTTARLIDETGQLLVPLEPQLINGEPRGVHYKIVTDSLLRSGYDGLIYQNTYEDRGMDSVIALFPQQVRPIPVASG